MKKHQFLHVDYRSSVKLTSSEKRKLNEWLHAASEVMAKLAKEGVFKEKPTSLHVSLLICGDSKIRTLNGEHRQKDKVTDVLSFPAHENLRRGIPGKEIFMGDLAVCFPQAKRQARKFKIGFWDEFIHLFFHGMLHLAGYDHEVSSKEEKIMQEWEDRAVKLFSGLRPK